VRSGLVLVAVLAAVTAAPATAGTGLAGKIVALGPTRIAVHGTSTLSCRIAASSPKAVRALTVGSRVALTCRRGVLTGIRRLGLLPATSTPGALPRSVVPFASAPPQTPSVSSIVGSYPITALSATSITFGAPPVSLTCSLGPGSPDLAGFELGDVIAKAVCTNGVLTSIARA